MSQSHQSIRLALALLFFPATGHCAAAEAPAKGFYKEPSLFSKAPGETASSQSIDRFGLVGIGLELVQPAFAMKVKDVGKDSPAEATGADKGLEMLRQWAQDIANKAAPTFEFLQRTSTQRTKEQ